MRRLRLSVLDRNAVTPRPLPCSMTVPYRQAMQWMRRRGDRVKIVSGKYAEQRCTFEGNVYHTGKNPIVRRECPS